MAESPGLVSITIPFHNSQDFLRDAIESVLAQSYTLWELFLVDDGSSDRSTTIALSYAAQFPGKIFYLEHPTHSNRGLSASRNLGALRSRGDFFAFLDSDDIWFPHKLHDQVTLMVGHPKAALLYGLSEYWYDWDPTDREGESNTVPQLAPGGRIYFPPSLLTFTYPFGPFGAPCPSSWLVRRAAFNRVLGFEESFNPSTCQMYEDTAFLTKIYLSEPVYVADSCWDRYRCHDQSMTRLYENANMGEQARKYYFRWLRNYMREQSISDPQVLRSIRSKAWPYWLPLPGRTTRLIRRIDNWLSRRQRLQE